MSSGIGITTKGLPGRISGATSATLSPASTSHPTTAKIVQASTAASIAPTRQSISPTTAGISLVGVSTVITSHTLPPQTRQSSAVGTTRFVVDSSINNTSDSAGGIKVSDLSSRIIVTATTVSSSTLTRGSNATLVTHVEGGGSTNRVPSLCTPENAVTTMARQPTASSATGPQASGPSGTARPTAQNATSGAISKADAVTSKPIFDAGNTTRLQPSSTTSATARSYSPNGRQTSGATESAAVVSFTANVTSVPPLSGASGSWQTRVAISGAAAATTAVTSEISARAANATTLLPDGIRNASAAGRSSSATSAALTAGGVRSSSTTVPVALTTTGRSSVANQTVPTPASSSWPVSGARVTSSAAAAVATEGRVNYTGRP